MQNISVGVMGKRIALQFKQNFPAGYFNPYKITCQNGELASGKVPVYALNRPLAHAPASTFDKVEVLLFPSK